jgi:hypothetical protein
MNPDLRVRKPTVAEDGWRHDKPMSLGQSLLESIRSGNSYIYWEYDDAKITVDVEVSDRLAMLLRSIYLLGGKHATMPFLLRNRVQALIDRLIWFDSSLRLIEWDQISNVAQIRGRPDKCAGMPPQYFEMIVDHYPSILVHRRSGNETIPFHISNDGFVKLIDEIVRIVRP